MNHDSAHNRAKCVSCGFGFGYDAGVATDALADVIARVTRTTGIDEREARQIVAELLDHLSEPVERYVRRRHGELHEHGSTNDRIWPVLSEEITQRRFPARPLSERQLRRIVYG